MDELDPLGAGVGAGAGAGVLDEERGGGGVGSDRKLTHPRWTKYQLGSSPELTAGSRTSTHWLSFDT